MRNRILIVIITLISTIGVKAQGIYEANLNTTNSIVRVWHEREVIIYNEETPGVGGFLYYAVGTPTAKHIDLPDGISVKDFRIFSNELYFCGEIKDPSILNGRAGVVGKFLISNTFNGIGIINYGIMTYWFDPYGYQMVVESLNRLELFPESGTIVMAMTGDTYLYNDPTQNRSTVVSAKFSSLANLWEVYALMDKHSTAKYTDIAVLQSSVIAVGTRFNGTGLLAKKFDKVNGFPNYPVTPNLCDSIICNNHNPIGKALITQTAADMAAVAQLDNTSSTMVHSLDFSGISAVPTSLTRITASPLIPYASPWDLQEIRYSSQTDNICVLEYGKLPGSSAFETLLWTFPYSTWISNYVQVQPFTIVTQASADVNIDNRPVTVGCVNGVGKLDLHSYIPGPIPFPYPLFDPDACTENDEIKYIKEDPAVRQVFIDDYPFLQYQLNENLYQPL